MLSDTGVKEYQSIYLKKYGKELSFEEAKQMATELLDFLSTLLPKKGGDTYENENTASQGGENIEPYDRLQQILPRSISTSQR